MSTRKTLSSNNAPLALYHHCESVYKALIEQAKTVYVAENDTTIIVWEGMLVHLITGKLHLSTPYYTTTTKALKRMGCIKQLKRGGGTAPSQWQLIKAPSLEAFENDLPVRTLVQGKYELLQTQLSAQEKRLAKLEVIFDVFFQKELADQEATKNED